MYMGDLLRLNMATAMVCLLLCVLRKHMARPTCDPEDVDGVLKKKAAGRRRTFGQQLCAAAQALRESF